MQVQIYCLSVTNYTVTTDIKSSNKTEINIQLIINQIQIPKGDESHCAAVR